MGDAVSLDVVKSERAEKDRRFARDALMKWLSEVIPDEIDGFAICCIKDIGDGEIKTWTRITGESVKSYAIAHHLGAIRISQYDAKEG